MVAFILYGSVVNEYEIARARLSVQVEVRRWTHLPPPQMKMSPPPMSAAGAAAAALALLLLLSSAGVLDGLSIPDSGLESPLGVREGFAFVTKPSTSSFFIAQQTMAVSSRPFQSRII